MQKSKIVTFLIVIVVIFLTVFFWMFGNKKVSPKPSLGDINGLNIPAGDSRILGNREDLIASSVWAGEELHDLVSFSGSVKGGYFFEANVGINILDANKKVLKSGHATATTDWTTSDPVSFKGDIDLVGLPTGPAYFEIHNDNPSGLPANDKSILIPIVIN